jgi:hypothetical protein
MSAILKMYQNYNAGLNLCDKITLAKGPLNAITELTSDSLTPCFDFRVK